MLTDHLNNIKVNNSYFNTWYTEGIKTVLGQLHIFKSAGKNPAVYTYSKVEVGEVGGGGGMSRKQLRRYRLNQF